MGTPWTKQPKFESTLKTDLGMRIKVKSIIEDVRVCYGSAIKFMEQHRAPYSEAAFFDFEESLVDRFEQGDIRRNVSPSTIRFAMNKLRSTYLAYERGKSWHPKDKFEKSRRWDHFYIPASMCVFNSNDKTIWIYGMGRVIAKKKLQIPRNPSKVRISINLETEELSIIVSCFSKS